MKKVESDCVACGFPCKGRACQYYEATHYYCDRCKEEAPLYYYDGEELCIECIEKTLEKVEGSEEC